MGWFATTGTLPFEAPRLFDAIVPDPLPAAAFFVAVLPGNVKAVRLYWHRPVLRAVMLARLPLQIPLVTEALAARKG